MMALRRFVSIDLGLGLFAGVWGLVSSSCTAQPLQPTGVNSEASAQVVTLPIEILIMIVKYFPVDGDSVDIRVTGDWGDTLGATRKKTERITHQTITALEEGSCYHGGVVRMWESNMSSTHGDVSNSNRASDDLPILSRTYTVYHYNYQRDVGEAVENHVHQIEHLLNHVEGRDATPAEKWADLLFWGKFVGSDRSHRMVPVRTPDSREVYRCGWTHYAPNSEHDYDWANPRIVETDIEDWQPDGIGKTRKINSDRWQGNDLKWKIYWMQSIPGADNGLTFKSKRLTDWRLFKGDWDYAVKNRIGLVERKVVEPAGQRARRIARAICLDG